MPEPKRDSVSGAKRDSLPGATRDSLPGAKHDSSPASRTQTAFPPRTWGFRLSGTDVAFIALCLAGALAAWLSLPLLAPLPAIACGHFFLFCNVFRVTRRLELIWTGVFVANVFAWSLSPAFNWLWILALQAPVTAVVILLELRSARYHGIFARRVNPRLEQWLQGEGS